MDIRSIGAHAAEHRVQLYVHAMSSRAHVLAQKRARQIAINYVRALRKHIRDQDLAWAPLSPTYARRKAAMGLDPRIWIATGQLYSQIRSFRGRSTKGREGWFGGVPKDAMHKDPATGKLTPTWEIVTRLEYGDPRRGIPPRDLFRASFREVIDREKQRDRRAGVR